MPAGRLRDGAEPRAAKAGALKFDSLAFLGGFGADVGSSVDTGDDRL